jgi:hypothetical protein
MMRLTKDEKLIRSIIEHESVIDGFSDGVPIEDLSRYLFFYDEGVGVYMAIINNNVVSVHPAIPKDNRGLKALKSARWLANFIVSKGYKLITRISYNKKTSMHFASLIGFTHVGDADGYKIYRYAK